MTMTPTPILLLTDEEVSRAVPPDDEPGFGALTTERGRLPLKAMDVYARLEGLLAEVTLTQTFVNVLSEPLEAVYIFPLPDRAAVTSFRMEVGGRVVEGELKERGAARRDYVQAIQSGHRAAITEEERSGVFTMRVGNLMPGESAKVRLVLTGPLTYDSGEVTFRFPLVVAPRYIPGHALPGPSVGDGTACDTDSVPDASRISPPVLLPGYPNPVRLTLEVDIEPAGLGATGFRCSLHSAMAEKGEDGVRRINLRPGERLNRDFILRFQVGDQRVRSTLTLVPDKPGAREGTFALTLLPPSPLPLSPGLGERGRGEGGTPRFQKPRDVVFVLDRSGSMQGWKMVAARRALGRMIDTLTERDSFTVYAFDDHVETPPEFGGGGLAPASDRNRYRAIEFLARVDARGGTELAQPLDLAVKQLASGGRKPPDEPARERILVLITDGQVGNEDQILKLLAKRLEGLRVFTLGIDQAVNEAFLKRLATLGGGFCEVVESEDRLDEVMKRLHSRISAPVLTGLKLEEAGFRIDEQATVPARVPDLFAGAALLVTGRYQGVPEGSILLSGQDAAGRPWREAVSSRISDNPALAKAWARGFVRELEDRFVTGQGDRSRLEKQIVDVSLRHGVLCRFTAFVAVDRSEVVNAGGKQHKIVQAVEMPAGWGEEEEILGRSCFGFAGRSLAARAMPAPPPVPCAAPPPVDEGIETVDSCLMEFNEPPGAALDDPEDPCRTLPPPTGKMRLKGVKALPGEVDQAKRRRKSRGTQGKPPASPPSPPKPPGLIKRMVNAVFGGKGEEAKRPAAPSVDLTAYRRRAGEMLAQVEAASVLPQRDWLQDLGVLTLNLKALLEDLTSVDAPAESVQPLRELLAELQQLLSQPDLDEQKAGSVWQSAQEVLRAFVTGQAPPAGRREQFWK
ncbi:MAG: VWA domain-containing protein [Gemmataceae bacterium]|nr:VWA domain-containing protein [Gemmataceae bacterium]